MIIDAPVLSERQVQASRRGCPERGGNRKRLIDYHWRVKRLLPVFVTVVLVVPVAVETAPKSASRITEASLRGHMEFLAGDALNGRGSGTRDEWIAAAYIGSRKANKRAPGVWPVRAGLL